MVLEKLRVLLPGGAIGAARSMLTAALGILLGLGPLQNSIPVQSVNVYYRIKNAQKVKLVKESEPYEFKSEGILAMPSDRIPQSYLFDEKFTVKQLVFRRSIIHQCYFFVFYIF